MAANDPSVRSVNHERSKPCVWLIFTDNRLFVGERYTGGRVILDDHMNTLLIKSYTSKRKIHFGA